MTKKKILIFEYEKCFICVCATVKIYTRLIEQKIVNQKINQKQNILFCNVIFKIFFQITIKKNNCLDYKSVLCVCV